MGKVYLFPKPGSTMALFAMSGWNIRRLSTDYAV